MAVHVHRQARRRREYLTHRHVAPAQQAVLKDDPAPRIHPTAGDHAQADGAASPAMARGETGDVLADLAEHLAGRAMVGRVLLGQHPAAQVHQAEGDEGHRDVHTAGDVVPGVDVQGNEGPACARWVGRYRHLPQQPERDHIRGLPRHSRRAQPGRPADEGTGHRPVVEHGAQDSRSGTSDVGLTRGGGPRRNLALYVHRHGMPSWHRGSAQPRRCGHGPHRRRTSGAPRSARGRETGGMRRGNIRYGRRCS